MTFSVTVLGSSSALPTSKRFTSACVLNAHERFFLIDCGEGAQIQLRRCHIKLSKINHIFISHLHGDHVLGLFGLFSSFNLLGRKTDLHIYANSGIKDLLNSYFRFFGKNDYTIVYHFLNPENSELIYEDKNILVTSFPLKHRVLTHGFLFGEKKRPNHLYKDIIGKYNIPLKAISDIKMGMGYTTEDGKVISNSELSYPSYSPRSFAYCTDTLYDESIIPVIKNVGLLWHEATYLDNLKNRAIVTFHSTAKEAGKIAALANVNHLIISHFSSRYKDVGPLVSEAKEEFEKVYAAQEGIEFIVEKDGGLLINNLLNN